MKPVKWIVSCQKIVGAIVDTTIEIKKVTLEGFGIIKTKWMTKFHKVPRNIKTNF